MRERRCLVTRSYRYQSNPNRRVPNGVGELLPSAEERLELSTEAIFFRVCHEAGSDSGKLEQVRKITKGHPKRACPLRQSKLLSKGSEATLKSSSETFEELPSIDI
jgi:hypothetical protein